MPEDQVRSVLSTDLLTRDISLKKAIDVITSTAKETLEPAEENSAE